MPRTTINIDAAVLRELRARQSRDGKPLGRLVSELLTSALGDSDRGSPTPFHWTSQIMGARPDFQDKEAVRLATS